MNDKLKVLILSLDGKDQVEENLKQGKMFVLLPSPFGEGWVSFALNINPLTQNHPFPRYIQGNANRREYLPTTSLAQCRNQDHLLLHHKYVHKRCIRIFCKLTLFSPDGRVIGKS